MIREKFGMYDVAGLKYYRWAKVEQTDSRARCMAQAFISDWIAQDRYQFEKWLQASRNLILCENLTRNKPTKTKMSLERAVRAKVRIEYDRILNILWNSAKRVTGGPKNE